MSGELVSFHLNRDDRYSYYSFNHGGEDFLLRDDGYRWSVYHPETHWECLAEYKHYNYQAIANSLMKGLLSHLRPMPIDGIPEEVRNR